MATKGSPKKASPRRQAYHHGDLRRALVDAAVALILERGQDAFTLREAARRVGVNHSAAYRHFDDKAALLAEVSAEGFDELGQRMTRDLARAKGEGARARLEILGTAYVGFALDRPAHFRVMMLGPRLNEDGRFPALEAATARAFGVVEGEVGRGLGRGEVGLSDQEVSARDLAVALWAMAHGFASLALTRRIAVSPRRLRTYFRHLLAPLLRGMAMA